MLIEQISRDYSAFQQPVNEQALGQALAENLLAQTDPVLVWIYKGMYFIQNCLEKTRDGKTDQL